MSALVRLIIMAIDPTYGSALIRDEQSASRQMRREVDTEVARMYLGNEADYVEMDPSAPAKLDLLKEIIGANPNYQMALGIIPGGRPNQRFAELLAKYQTNLQMSVKQETEAKPGGRFGVVPEEPALQAG